MQIKVTTFNKCLLFFLVTAFVALVVVTTFIPYPPSVAEARDNGFSASEIDTGLQFSYERRLFMWFSQALELCLLCIFALTPVCRRLADRWLAWTGQRRILAAMGVGFCFWLVHVLFYIPVGIFSLQHRWAWEMSNQDYADWFRDYAIG